MLPGRPAFQDEAGSTCDLKLVLFLQRPGGQSQSGAGLEVQLNVESRAR